jgi:hypothetical protein
LALQKEFTLFQDATTIKQLKNSTALLISSGTHEDFIEFMSHIMAIECIDASLQNISSSKGHKSNSHGI